MRSIREVAALAVRDGHLDQLPLRGGAGERRVGGFHADGDGTAHETELPVAQQRAGKQAALDQNLESVADAQNQAALLREFLHRGHDRREFGDGAAAQVVAVGESARQNHRIGVAERSGIVPDEFGRLAQIVRDRVPRVVVAIASRKHDDAESHRGKLQCNMSEMEALQSARAPFTIGDGAEAVVSSKSLTARARSSVG